MLDRFQDWAYRAVQREGDVNLVPAVSRLFSDGKTLEL